MMVVFFSNEEEDSSPLSKLDGNEKDINFERRARHEKDVPTVPSPFRAECVSMITTPTRIQNEQGLNSFGIDENNGILEDEEFGLRELKLAVISEDDECPSSEGDDKLSQTSSRTECNNNRGHEEQLTRHGTPYPAAPSHLDITMEEETSRDGIKGSDDGKIKVEESEIKELKIKMFREHSEKPSDQKVEDQTPSILRQGGNGLAKNKGFPLWHDKLECAVPSPSRDENVDAIALSWIERQQVLHEGSVNRNFTAVRDEEYLPEKCMFEAESEPIGSLTTDDERRKIIENEAGKIKAELNILEKLEEMKGDEEASEEKRDDEEVPTMKEVPYVKKRKVSRHPPPVRAIEFRCSSSRSSQFRCKRDSDVPDKTSTQAPSSQPETPHKNRDEDSISTLGNPSTLFAAANPQQGTADNADDVGSSRVAQVENEKLIKKEDTTKSHRCSKKWITLWLIIFCWTIVLAVSLAVSMPFILDATGKPSNDEVSPSSPLPGQEPEERAGSDLSTEQVPDGNVTVRKNESLPTSLDKAHDSEQYSTTNSSNFPDVELYSIQESKEAANVDEKSSDELKAIITSNIEANDQEEEHSQRQYADESG